MGLLVQRIIHFVILLNYLTQCILACEQATA